VNGLRTLSTGNGMRILVFGRTGQLARELGGYAWPAGVSVIQADRGHCDLARVDEVRRAIEQAKPDVVINAAAYTSVDRAETEEPLARSINAIAPGAMAQSCEILGATLIHLSTDYVFDGAKPGPYAEGDPVRPLSAYGRSKADGERAIRAATRNHVILRTTWVFASHGTNFVRTMLRQPDSRSEIRVVSDQRGAPTAARDIAGAIATIVDAVRDGRGAWGTFHYTSAEPTTWHLFAEAIFEGARRRMNVIPIPTSDYLTAARRPLNSILDCSLIRAAYGIEQPSWRRALADVIGELGAKA
jgi:dTDP-4-dehydrorhamnose reductase